MEIPASTLTILKNTFVFYFNVFLHFNGITMVQNITLWKQSYPTEISLLKHRPSTEDTDISDGNLRFTEERIYPHSVHVLFSQKKQNYCNRLQWKLRRVSVEKWGKIKSWYTTACILQVILMNFNTQVYKHKKLYLCIVGENLKHMHQNVKHFFN